MEQSKPPEGGSDAINNSETHHRRKDEPHFGQQTNTVAREKTEGSITRVPVSFPANMSKQNNDPREKDTGSFWGEAWAEDPNDMAINFRKTAPGIPPHGVKETMIMDEAVNLENATTNMLTYVRPQFPGVRLKGIRREKIENAIMDQMIREETELNTVPPSSLIHFCSTTQRDFRAGGFKPQPIPTVHYHDYTSENAVTFWSENYKQAQGVTAVSNPKAPFKRSAYFSTPLSERVDDEGPPLFNCDEWDNFDFSISNYNYKKNRDGRF